MPTAELARVVGWKLSRSESESKARRANVGDLIPSIAAHGIREPLTEYRGKLEGNHRFAAAIALGLTTVPVYRGK